MSRMVWSFDFFVFFIVKSLIFSPAGWVMLLVGTSYKCYLFSKNYVSLNDAEDICLSFLANLVTFETSTEFSAVMTQALLEKFEWYWIGYYASKCDAWGTYTYSYLINNQLATMSFISPYWPGRPTLNCASIYLLLRSDDFIFDWPQSSIHIKPYICEMR
jgi:hypothetical protein